MQADNPVQIAGSVGWIIHNFSPYLVPNSNIPVFIRVFHGWYRSLEKKNRWPAGQLLKGHHPDHAKEVANQRIKGTLFEDWQFLRKSWWVTKARPRGTELLEEIDMISHRPSITHQSLDGVRLMAAAAPLLLPVSDHRAAGLAKSLISSTERLLSFFLSISFHNE